MAEPSRTHSVVRSDVPTHVLIVEARFYDPIADQLLAGAKATLETAGATFHVVTVPGALEIAGALAILLGAEEGRYDAAVALGCVLRGETYHFEIVSNESARAVTDVAVRQRFPIGNGVLTVEDEAQANVRADPARGNKGGEAAHAALVLLQLKRQSGVR